MSYVEYREFGGPDEDGLFSWVRQFFFELF